VLEGKTRRIDCSLKVMIKREAGLEACRGKKKKVFSPLAYSPMPKVKGFGKKMNLSTDVKEEEVEESFKKKKTFPLT